MKKTPRFKEGCLYSLFWLNEKTSVQVEAYQLYFSFSSITLRAIFAEFERGKISKTFS
jgi:hypothetical protein